MNAFVRAALTVAAILLLSSVASAQEPVLLEDIDRTEAEVLVTDATVAFDRIFFDVFIEDRIRPQLWVSTGEPGESRRLANLDQTKLWRGEGRVMFAGEGGTWVSDGTADGTVRVVDGWPQFVASRGTDFFFSNPDGELWFTNGTREGTRRLTVGLSPSSSLIEKDGYAYFMSVGCELWRSDGTLEGTARTWLPSGITDPLSHGPCVLTPGPGGRLLIQLSDSEVAWVSTGTNGWRADYWAGQVSMPAVGRTFLVRDGQLFVSYGTEPPTLVDEFLAGIQLLATAGQIVLVQAPLGAWITDGEQVEYVGERVYAWERGANGDLHWIAETDGQQARWYTDGTLDGTQQVEPWSPKHWLLAATVRGLVIFDVPAGVVRLVSDRATRLWPPVDELPTRSSDPVGFLGSSDAAYYRSRFAGDRSRSMGPPERLTVWSKSVAPSATTYSLELPGDELRARPLSTQPDGRLLFGWDLGYSVGADGAWQFGYFGLGEAAPVFVSSASSGTDAQEEVAAEWVVFLEFGGLRIQPLYGSGVGGSTSLRGADTVSTGEVRSWREDGDVVVSLPACRGYRMPYNMADSLGESNVCERSKPFTLGRSDERIYADETGVAAADPGAIIRLFEGEVKQLRPIVRAAAQIAKIGGAFYFIGETDDRTQIWRTDGTPNGTRVFQPDLLVRGWTLNEAGDVLVVHGRPVSGGDALFVLDDDGWRPLTSTGSAVQPRTQVGAETFDSSIAIAGDFVVYLAERWDVGREVFSVPLDATPTASRDLDFSGVDLLPPPPTAAEALGAATVRGGTICSTSGPVRAPVAWLWLLVLAAIVARRPFVAERRHG